MSREQLRELLEIDPLQLAEDFTGVSYKDDEATSMLGMALMFKLNEVKKAELIIHNDSYFGMKTGPYISLIESMGFVQAMKLPFQGKYEIKEEFLFVYCQPKTGVFIVFDTCGGEDNLNGGRMNYCIRFKEGASRYCTSSGRYESEKHPNWRREFEHPNKPEDLYWKGDHDCREAIRMHYNQLKDNGEFLCPWPKDPNQKWTDLNLLHYADWRALENIPYPGKTKVVDDLNKLRIEFLPEWARKIINEE